MISFTGLKENARKVDEGIDQLEKRLQNPYDLYVVTPEMIEKTTEELDEIKSDVQSMMKGVQEFINDQDENIEENARTVQYAHDVMDEIEETVSGAQNYLQRFGIMSFEEFQANRKNNELQLDSSYRTGSNNELRKEFLFDGTPSFKAPNYNSTPESYNMESSNGTASNYTRSFGNRTRATPGTKTPFANGRKM